MYIFFPGENTLHVTRQTQSWKIKYRLPRKFYVARKWFGKIKRHEKTIRTKIKEIFGPPNSPLGEKTVFSFRITNKNKNGYRLFRNLIQISVTHQSINQLTNLDMRQIKK